MPNRRIAWPVILTVLLFGLFCWKSVAPGVWIAGAALISFISWQIFRLPGISLEWIAQNYETRDFSISAKIIVFTLQLVMVLLVDHPRYSGLSLVLSLGWLLLMAKLPLYCYLPAFRLPLVFLALSAMVFMFERSPSPSGVINLPLWSSYLSVTSAGRIKTATIFLKVLASYHALLALILTTPMRKLMAQLESLRVPSIVTELMYLIHRNIQILGSILQRAQASAHMRLGYAGYFRTGKTMRFIGSRLLAQGINLSRIHYATLEGRLYDNQIRLLQPPVAPALSGWLYLAGALFGVIGVIYVIA